MRSDRRVGLVICVYALLCALPGVALAGESIKLLRSLGYSESSFVRPAIKTECDLEERLPEAITFARKNGIEIELVDKLPSSGRVLELEISDAIETGNAWTGRQKGLLIQGRLVENGVAVGNFRGRRMTSGGLFGGYKGTCSFLGRCAKTLGHDVADWLKAPAGNSNIGGSRRASPRPPPRARTASRPPAAASPTARRSRPPARGPHRRRRRGTTSRA